MNDIGDQLKTFDIYIGQGVNRLSLDVGINPDLNKNKSGTNNIVKRLLKRHESAVQNLKQAARPDKLLLKSIVLDHKGRSKQNTVIEEINFFDWAEGEWEDSIIKRRFETTVFLFMVFATNNRGEIFFIGTQVWKMPFSKLEGLQPYWMNVKKILSEGVIFTEKKQKNKTITMNNLPGMAANEMIHIRPKANDKNQITYLPDGQTITKQGLWLNSKYVTKIVAPLYENYMYDIQAMRDIEIKSIETDRETNHKLKEILTEDAYTPQSFTQVCRKILPRFKSSDISDTLVKDLGYHIASPYILKQRYRDSREYIEEIILGRDYFEFLETPTLSHPYAERMLTKMQDGWRIIELEKGFFITEKALFRAGIHIKTLEQFRNMVADQIEIGIYYTTDQIRNLVPNHEIEEYGFENRFYEGVLKRPGKISHVKIGKNYLFTNGVFKSIPDHLLKTLLVKKESMHIEDLISRVKELYEIEVSPEDMITFVRKTTSYYAQEFEKVFEDKEKYLNQIYN